MRTAENAMLIHAAAEAKRLLDYFGITFPSEIVLEDIAAGLDVEVNVGPLSGAEAHLVRVGDIGCITVSDRLLCRGARRFAIAHELGHWRMHEAISQTFFCTETDLQEYRNSGPELEANTFAAELLMPKSMIDPKLLSIEPDWCILQQIVSCFGVAPVSAAIRYADLARQPVIAVISNGRNVGWWRENRQRVQGLWLESKQSLSEESIAYHVQNEPGYKPSLEQVPWEAWFPHIDADEDAELFELAAPMDDRGTMLSLLWIPAR